MQDLMFAEEFGELKARHLNEWPCHAHQEVPGLGFGV
jgi:hypothetical protein